MGKVIWETVNSRLVVNLLLGALGALITISTLWVTGLLTASAANTLAIAEERFVAKSLWEERWRSHTELERSSREQLVELTRKIDVMTKELSKLTGRMEKNERP